jgi:hypothetical protein
LNRIIPLFVVAILILTAIGIYPEAKAIDFNEGNIENSCEIQLRNSAYFLIGLFRFKWIQCGWGFYHVWSPIFAFRIEESNEWSRLDPSSEDIKIDYYNINGYRGIRRHLSHPDRDVIIFVLARLTPY